MASDFIGNQMSYPFFNMSNQVKSLNVQWIRTLPWFCRQLKTNLSLNKMNLIHRADGNDRELNLRLIIQLKKKHHRR